MTQPEDEDAGQEWSAMGLEEAYLRALETNEAVEWEMDHAAVSADGESSLDDEAASDTQSESATSDGDEDADGEGSSTEELAAEVEASADDGEATDDTSVDAGEETEWAEEEEEEPARITPKQVIEAALFVGGQPLTAKKLCYLLKGDADLDFVEQAIDDLNHQYIDECRPYEIRLSEGGYRLVLHEEFQRLRNRVYGIGPREVRLSQDVLEVLALVAYRQPITPAKIEELGKPNAAPVLRQLLRRELISLERDATDRKLVRYRTTRRFLSVFGLGTLDDLPQADDLMFK